MTKIIVDTGPIVAFFNSRDAHHTWIKTQFAKLVPPLLTSEVVLAEAWYLLRNLSDAREALLECLHRKIFVVSFSLTEEITAVKKLLARYNSVPMSLADACLVRMSEHYHNSSVLTFDNDFHIYRRHGREVIPVLMPKNH